MEIPSSASRLPDSSEKPVSGNRPHLTGAPFNAANGFETGGPFGTRPPQFSTPPIPPGRAPSRDVSIKDVMDLVSKSLLIIRAKWYWGLLAAVILGGAAAFFLLSRPIEYSAHTLVLAQSTLDKVVGTQADQSDGTETRENVLKNHLSLMNSHKFLVRLIASFTPEEKTLISDPYLKAGIPEDEDFFEHLMDDKISVARERGAELYNVQVTHTDPAIAMLVANRFTAEYIKLVQSEYRNANKAGLDLLQNQSDSLRQEIARLEEERLDFKKKNRIISRADNQGILSERLHRLDGNLTDVRVRRFQLEAQFNQARLDRAKSTYPWDNPYLAAFANNDTLRQQLDLALAQRAVLASRYGVNHPKMRDIDASIQGIQASIQRNFDVAVRDLGSQFESAKTAENQLKTEFDTSFADSMEIEKIASRYDMIGSDVENKRLMLAQVEKKLGEAKISHQLPENFMQIVDPAYIVKPKIPKQVLYVAFAILLALGTFVATPIILDLLDERIKGGTSDVELVLGKPLLGAIPYWKLPEADRAHVVRNQKDRLRAEALMGISAQLDFSSHEPYPKCILVTSTVPGEGKSTVVANLASAYTLLGKKVVILDLDLRRPAQHRLHGVQSTAGFLTWAKNGFGMENLLKSGGALGLQTLADGTHLIPAGGADAQPGHYFVSDHLGALLSALKSTYDLVIIDSPPAGVFPDAVVLSRHAQDRILVVREARAPVEQIKKTISNFARASADLTGLVLNAFNPRTAHRKLAYGYDKNNHGYYNHTATAAPVPPKSAGARI